MQKLRQLPVSKKNLFYFSEKLNRVEFIFDFMHSSRLLVVTCLGVFLNVSNVSEWNTKRNCILTFLSSENKQYAQIEREKINKIANG